MRKLKNNKTEELLIHWLRLNPVSSNVPNRKMFYDFVISLFEDGDDLDDQSLAKLTTENAQLNGNDLETFVDKTLDDITEFKGFLGHLEEMGKLDM